MAKYGPRRQGGGGVVSEILVLAGLGGLRYRGGHFWVLGYRFVRGPAFICDRQKLQEFSGTVSELHTGVDSNSGVLR